jgi:hypothetical protein
MSIYDHIDTFINKKLSNKDITNYFLCNPVEKTHELHSLIELKIKTSQQLNKYIRETINIKDINKKIEIYLVNNTELQSLFETFVSLFYLESCFIYNHGHIIKLKHKHCYLAIDLEFGSDKLKGKTKQVLLQLHFEHFKNSWIFIVDPNSFSDTFIKIFTKYVLENKYILKLFHGSETLDLPYINNHFCKHKDSFYKFMNHTYDTVFICQYVKSYTNYLVDSKTNSFGGCSLYTALKDFNVIDEKQFNYLNELSNSMGKIQYVKWKINDMSDTQIKYAYYDVVYLRILYRNILRESKKKSVIYYGVKIIPEIYRLNMFSKLLYTNIVENTKNNMDKINGCIVPEDNNKQLVSYFDKLLLTHVLENKFSIYSLTFVPYIKKTYIALLKQVIYTYLSKKYQLYINNKQKLNTIISYDHLFVELDKLYMTHTLNMLQQINII